MTNRQVPLRSVTQDKISFSESNINVLEEIVDTKKIKGLSELEFIENFIKKEQLEDQANKDENSINQKISNQNILPKNKASETEVFFTKDRDLLNQYYALRHEIYCNENGWTNYPTAESDFDRKGKIIVAVKDGKVIGGMRLLISNQVDHFPNEELGTEFTYRNFLQKVGLDQDAVIAEISSFFVEKNNRDSTVSTMMFRRASEEAEISNCSYIVAVAMPLVCRSNKKYLGRIGYRAEVFMSYPWISQKSQNYASARPMVIFLK